jgi:hypothetical protein
VACIISRAAASFVIGDAAFTVGWDCTAGNAQAETASAAESVMIFSTHNRHRKGGTWSLGGNDPEEILAPLYRWVKPADF